MRPPFRRCLATKVIEKGATIWCSETFHGEHLGCDDTVCSNCFCALLTIAAGKRHRSDTDPSKRIGDAHTGLRCPNGGPCDAVFCSMVCLIQATASFGRFGWHSLCCVGHRSQTAAPCRAFRDFCARTSDTFSIVANIVARTLNPRFPGTLQHLLSDEGPRQKWQIVAARAMLQGVNVRYEAFVQLQTELKDNITQSWQLLVGFWSLFDDFHVKALLESLTFDSFSQLAAMVELHFKAVSFASFQREVYEESCVRKLLERSRVLQQDVHGLMPEICHPWENTTIANPQNTVEKERSTRLLIYSPEISTLSHSCSPNTQLEVERGSYGLCVKLIALHQIATGEHLTISLVPLSSLTEMRRRKLVAQYGICCYCPRCRWESKISCESWREEAMSRLCNQYLEEGKYQEAELLCRFMLTKWYVPEYLHTLGQCLLGQGKSLSALDAWHGAHTRFPSHSTLAEQVRKDNAYDSLRLPVYVAHNVHSDLQPVSGSDIWISSNPILSPAQCSKWIQLAEDAATLTGGWSTQRHYSVPTTDLPIHSIPEILKEWNLLMHTAICPLLCRAIPEIDRENIRVHDAFVVKYDAVRGQRFLPLHSDEGDWSLTLALNSGHEYEGGGTLFDEHNLLLRPQLGGFTAFRSSLMHAGAPVSRGTRYIVAAFLLIV